VGHFEDGLIVWYAAMKAKDIPSSVLDEEIDSGDGGSGYSRQSNT
jgi:hypothetical protein